MQSSHVSSFCSQSCSSSSRAQPPRLHWMLALASIALVACGGDGDAPDAARVEDAAGLVDAAIDVAIDGGGASADAAPGDGGAHDAGPLDAEVADAEVADDAPSADAFTAMDANPSADAVVSGCHAVGFGGAVLALTFNGRLPAMTGGTIPAGTYDAVRFETSGVLEGTYRGTWVFRADGSMDVLQQVNLGGFEPEPSTPRTFSWSTAGTTLTRTETCPGTVESFANEFTYDAASGQLLVRQSTILFVFQRRAAG